MVQIKQLMETLSPQPTLSSAGTPQRVATSTVPTRTIIFEAAAGNVGVIKVADSEAKASTVNAHSLDAGAHFTVGVDNFGNVDAFLDINNFWFDSSESGDKLVVSYLIDQTNPED